MITTATCQIVGHCAQDAKSIGNKGAGAVAVAVNTRANEPPSYFDVIIGPKTFAAIGNLVTKGTPVIVHGRLSIRKTDKYTNVNIMSDFFSIAEKIPQSGSSSTAPAADFDDDIPF